MIIWEIVKSIILGIVQGITEWLPISSTGHMILLNEILPLRIGKNPDDFYSMFEVVIQLGAILAVVVLFWSQIWPFGSIICTAGCGYGAVSSDDRQDYG